MDYRLTFPTLAAGETDAMQIAEAQFLTTTHDLLVGAEITGTRSDGEEFYAEVIRDGELSSKLGAPGNGSTELVIIPAVGQEGLVARGITLISGDDNATWTGRHPTSLRLEGSNDSGEIWTEIYANPNVEPVDENFVWQEHAFWHNTAAYGRYRLTLGPPVNGSFLQLAEIQLHAGPADASIRAPVDVDGDVLTFSLVTGPAHGSVVVNADGAFTYTPAAGFSGEDSFTVKASDGWEDSPVATVNVTITPGGSLFAAWQNSQFTPAQQADPAISGPEADPDHDGLVNLLEYALGRPPLTASRGGLPERTVETVGGEEYFVFTIQKNPEAGDVELIPEISDSLEAASWESGPGSFTLVEETATLLRVRENRPAGDHPRRFFRLNVRLEVP